MREVIYEWQPAATPLLEAASLVSLSRATPIGVPSSMYSTGRCSPGRLSSRSSDPATLTLAHATPNSELLAVSQSEFKAVVFDDTTTTDLFGLLGRCTPLRKEKIGIDAHAVRS
jgi:hypothetical protein